MYVSVRDWRTARADPAAAGRRTISSTIILLGLTSLFTDISSEMVAAVLPLFARLPTAWWTGFTRACRRSFGSAAAWPRTGPDDRRRWRWPATVSQPGASLRCSWSPAARRWVWWSPWTGPGRAFVPRHATR
jgi:hypothetical protein